MAMKNVMVIGAGVLQVPIIKEINKAGHFSIVLDKNDLAPGFSLAKKKIKVDISNSEKAVKEAIKIDEQHKIHAVLTVATDFTYTVNQIKKKLGLPCLSQAKSLIFSNKGKLRQFLTEHKFPQPKFVIINEVKDLEKIFLNLLFPVVVKPVDSMGARGVIKLEKLNQTLAELKSKIKIAYLAAKGFSRRGEVIVEEFIKGKEYSIDALIINGKVTITGFADRVIEFPPYFVETGHIIPSLEKSSLQKKIKKEFISVVDHLKIENGAVKADVFLNHNDQIIIGELAFRLSGGFMSTHTFPLASGINLMKAILDLNLGKKNIDLKEKKKLQVVEKSVFLSPPNKSKNDDLPITLKQIKGLDFLEKIKNIKKIHFYKKINDKVYNPKNNLMKIASIIIVAKSISKINEVVKLVADKLQVNNARIYFPLLSEDRLVENKPKIASNLIKKK